MLGHGQREQGQAGLPQMIQIFTLVDPGAGFQQQSLSSGVKVAQEVEEKSKKTEATGKEMRGREGQKDRWGGEPEVATSLGVGVGEKVAVLFHAETPPAHLMGYTGVPSCPKSKPRTSPWVPHVHTLQIVYTVFVSLTE